MNKKGNITLKNLARSASATALLLIISKILGFAREVFLADRFGTTYIADAYVIAASLPSVLFALFASGFTQSFIPSYVRADPKNKARFFSNTCSVLFLISLLITGVCIAFRQNIVSLLAPGFSTEPAALTARFIAVISFYLPIFTIFNVLTAYLAAQEDFIPGGFCDFILVNLVLIASILIATPQRPMILAYGYVASMILALAVLWAYARRKHGLRWEPVLDLHDRDFRHLCTLAIPLGLSLMADQINGVVDRMFASGLGEGVTSALSYANRVQSILLTLTTTIFIQVCYPRMNLYFAAGEKEKGSGYVQKALLIACYTSIPLVVMFALYAQPIISLIFQRGAFSDESNGRHVGVPDAVCAGDPVFRLPHDPDQHARRQYAAEADPAEYGHHCGEQYRVDFLLVRIWGYRGLALATSLSGVLAASLMYRDIRTLNLPVFTRRQAADVVKYTLATACAAAVSLPVYRALLTAWSDELSALAAIAAAGMVYVFVTVLLKSELLIWLHAHLPSRLQILRGYFPVSEDENR